MQIVQPGKSKQAADKAEAKPQTPADIINARGFWDDTPATPKQATPAQVAAINARQALASADPQSTASVPAAYQAMAYAPASTSPVDRAQYRRGQRADSPQRPAGPQFDRQSPTIDLVVAKGTQGQGGVVATSTRIAASRADDAWMRVMMLAPSASTSMSATVLGDADLTPDERAFRQAAGCHRDGLLGRSADGHELRPIQRIGRFNADDAVLRAADRIVALGADRHCQARAQSASSR